MFRSSPRILAGLLAPLFLGCASSGSDSQFTDESAGAAGQAGDTGGAGGGALAGHAGQGGFAGRAGQGGALAGHAGQGGSGGSAGHAGSAGSGGSAGAAGSGGKAGQGGATGQGGQGGTPTQGGQSGAGAAGQAGTSGAAGEGAQGGQSPVGGAAGAGASGAPGGGAGQSGTAGEGAGQGGQTTGGQAGMSGEAGQGGEAGLAGQGGQAGSGGGQGGEGGDTGQGGATAQGGDAGQGGATAQGGDAGQGGATAQGGDAGQGGAQGGDAGQGGAQGGEAGQAGAGGASTGCSPTGPASGAPIVAPDSKWTWVPFPEALCRNGSTTGIGVRLEAASDRLLVYLEGGGVCFNGTTCAISTSSFGSAAFNAWASALGSAGVFDPTRADNPFQGWNVVYVPACTGDFHAGARSGVDVPGGPSQQQFVGYKNVGKYLERLVPTFASVKSVVLSGAGTGGLGALFNFDQVSAAFCPTPVSLIDDSGPLLSDTYLAPCLQSQWRALWNLDATALAGCADCQAPGGGGMVNQVTYLQSRWPQSQVGLISSTHDSSMSTLFGYGASNCTASVPLPGATYAAGLDELRDQYIAKSSRWGTYYVNSTKNTYETGPGFFTTTVQGTKLTDWVGSIVNGQSTNVGP